jgi:WbqC-like protein family
MVFPWPGFFELVATADIYVHLDDVKFSNKSFTNRVQVKHANGWSWMSIPIRKTGNSLPIRSLTAADTPWKRRHRAMLAQSLARARHLDAALALFDSVYRRLEIVELLIDSIEESARYLGIWKPATSIRSSGMGILGRGSERVLAMVLALGGTRYVTAHGARNYLDHVAFERAGVAVEYIAYSKTPYRQLHGEFLPYVTILDLIAALGPEARSIIQPATMPWKEFLAEAPG